MVIFHKQFTGITMTTSVMIDLETLDTTSTSVVATIAAIKFNPEFDYRQAKDPTELEHLYIKVDLNQIGRTSSQETLDWWNTQDSEIKEDVFNDDGNRYSLNAAMALLNEWVAGADHYWANGIVFDYSILEDCNRQFGFTSPWKYWQVMDARTIYKMVPDHTIPQSGKHNALWDCFNQIQRLTDCFNRLRAYPNK